MTKSHLCCTGVQSGHHVIKNCYKESYGCRRAELHALYWMPKEQHAHLPHCMFNELNWIPFFFIEAYISRCSIASKRIEGTTPDYINSILKTNSEIHNRSTRFANLNFHCPVFKKNTEGGRTFSVRTIGNWKKRPWT